MKRFFCFSLFCFHLSLGLCFGEIKWYNPLEHGAQVHGHGWEELYGSYTRLPDRAEGIVRESIWNLSKNSAGLSLVFRCNACDITVRYKVTRGLQMFHMPSTGVSGIDLYAIDSEGKTRWCNPDFPPKLSSEEVKYTFSDIDYYPDSRRYYEYHLYLPLYNGISRLEIGISEDAEIVFLPVSPEKPIVAYGTSITQGACASRPGNAWTNIIERETGHPVVNLGFSGNGKLEPEMFNLLAEIDAQMYIIDCMPNMEDNADSVYCRVLAGVNILRREHDCPIILAEHTGFSPEVSHNATEYRMKPNEGLAKAFGYLCSQGVTGLHYIKYDEFGMTADGMVEGRHTNDLGMHILAEAYLKKIREILHEEASLFKPCTQHRPSYMWYDRHVEALKYCATHKPEIVLLGDSITHQWGGNPVGHLVNGSESWEKMCVGGGSHNAASASGKGICVRYNAEGRKGRTCPQCELTYQSTPQSG